MIIALSLEPVAARGSKTFAADELLLQPNAVKRLHDVRMGIPGMGMISDLA
jgi:hypothetical protein